MTRQVRIVLIVLAVAVVGLVAWRVWAPRAADKDMLSGYVEGDDLYLSSPVAGSLGAVYVTKGQRVAANAPLFAMDPATLSAQQGQAQGRLGQARAQIDAAEAQAAQAQANVASAQAAASDARRDYQRFAGLQKSNPAAVAAQQVDQARAQADSAAAQLQAARKAAAAARLTADASRASAQQAQAGVREAGVRLGQLAQRAPASGRIEDVFYQSGEWAGPNQPIVALLPDDEVKLRFFVPETAVQAYRPGGSVRFACDGCRQGQIARISYVAPRAEFTPPVIYSRNSRGKLVFLVEAVPADAKGLQPGLPVDVVPLTHGRGSRP